jgi:hypothetical protein
VVKRSQKTKAACVLDAEIAARLSGDMLSAVVGPCISRNNGIM